jgi:hypothetical protein
MSRHVTGLEKVMRNFNVAVAKLKQRSERGLYMGGALIIRTAKSITPVDTGNLRASAAVKRPVATMFGPVVEIGYYGVDYAVWVHEVPAYHRVGNWKFLEYAITMKQREVIKIIRDEAKL